MPSCFPPPPSAAHSLALLASFLLLALLLLSSLLFHHPPPRALPPAASSACDYHRLFLSLSANASATIAEHLRHLTSGPHLAGTPASLAAHSHVLRSLDAAGLPAASAPLLALLSYPVRSSLSLLSSPPRPLPLSDSPLLPPPYHAFSPSAALAAPAVYAHLARRRDFHTLRRLRVPVAGAVVLVRRGASSRAALVARAAALGAAAVLTFRPDPPPEVDEQLPGGFSGRGGVERGTVLLGGPGDPLTPGWAAEPGAERLSVSDDRVRARFPSIPSMPIPAKAAEEILQTLGGPTMPAEWREGLHSPLGGVGPGPLLLNFTFKEEKKLANIKNIIGVIEGREEPDRYVILGNHRDAWTYGAVDPNSGTSVLLDIARRFGILLQQGWRPRRTIILCSWDAEEFGMIGSTEWVEQNIANLGLNAVAYLNVDCAVQGSGFFASATPQLDKLLHDVTKKVKDPDAVTQTVFQAWETMEEGVKIGRLNRMDSDFSAFLHHAGIPSIDMYFGKDFPVYHTAFDSYDWMEKYGDPLFHRHVAMAEIWGLLALTLADSPVLPFDYRSYVGQLQKHTGTMYNLFGSQNLHFINNSVDEFGIAANEVQMEMLKLMDQMDADGHSEQRRRSLNDRLMQAERGFLEPEGLKGRPWFKHTVYSPPEDDESSADGFPGIVDSIYRSKETENGDGKQEIHHEIWRVARAIKRAAQILRGSVYQVN